jgi:prepilin-type N-terminal cleavage/methylation domain-containing protein
VRSRKRGFTLIEALLVMLIISILAGIALPLLRGAVARADAAKVRTDVRTIELAALQFREEDGRFPPTSRWGQNPGILDEWLAEGTEFTYKDVSYRMVRGGNPRRGERFRIQVRYPLNSLIGEALQTFRGPDVIWTRRRTTFQLFP